jgi:hypothetical protein
MSQVENTEKFTVHNPQLTAQEELFPPPDRSPLSAGGRQVSARGSGVVKWSDRFPVLFRNYGSEVDVSQSQCQTVEHNMGFYRDDEGYAIGDCIDRIEDTNSRFHNRLIFFHCEFLDVPDPVRNCRKTYRGRFYLLPKDIQAEILQLAHIDHWTEIYEILANRADMIRVRCAG